MRSELILRKKDQPDGEQVDGCCRSWLLFVFSFPSFPQRVQPAIDKYYTTVIYMCLRTSAIDLCTSKRQYRKFEKNIPRKGIARRQSNIHIHLSVSDLYIPRMGLPILLQENTVCGSILRIYKSLTQTQVCGNWD